MNVSEAFSMFLRQKLPNELISLVSAKREKKSPDSHGRKQQSGNKRKQVAPFFS